jgi:hypothetical protein
LILLHGAVRESRSRVPRIVFPRVRGGVGANGPRVMLFSKQLERFSPVREGTLG